MKISFWKFFRLIFVMFSLYLMGDAFYRWDAFRYYGTFMEFVPGVALVSVLWSALSFLAAISIWIMIRVILKLSDQLNLRVSVEQLILSFLFIVILIGIAWGGKRLVWSSVQTSSQLKFGLMLAVVIFALTLSWRFRGRAQRWVDAVYEKMVPLNWLFGTVVILSVPMVFYFALSGQAVTSGLEIEKSSSVNGISRPNIVLITFDALTARDMSVYGYDRETTPFITDWARTASVFTMNEAAGNYTAPTTASLMTGKRIWTHRRFQSNAGAPIKSETESLPLLLRNNGYYNLAFVANNLASSQELGMVNSFMVAPLSNEFTEPVSIYGFLGYHLYRLFGTKIKMYYWITDEDFILYKLMPDNYVKHPHKTEIPPEKTFQYFLNEIKGNIREPYFAWIHIHPPHAPYLPPDEYAGLFDLSQKFRQWKDQYPLVRQRYFAENQQPDADIIRARYDEFIRYCDREFQKFIEPLDKTGQLNNAVIILSADHGESFEHGYFTHGGPYLFEQMTHLPLIIKEPGQIEGHVIDAVVEQVDTPATILDLAGISIPSWMEGRSLVPLLRGDEIEPKPAFSMNFDHNPSLEKITKGTIAVWEGDYKLVHYLEKDTSLLFNLKQDPDEVNNLIGKEPETGQRLLSLIRNNLEKVNEGYSERQ